jgi:hypothetical protein
MSPASLASSAAPLLVEAAAALITNEMRVRLRLDAQQAEETELSYIDLLRRALQERCGINKDDSNIHSQSSEFGDDTGLPTKDNLT